MCHFYYACHIWSPSLPSSPTTQNTSTLKFSSLRLHFASVTMLLLPFPYISTIAYNHLFNLRAVFIIHSVYIHIIQNNWDCNSKLYFQTWNHDLKSQFQLFWSNNFATHLFHAYIIYVVQNIQFCTFITITSQLIYVLWVQSNISGFM